MLVSIDVYGGFACMASVGGFKPFRCRLYGPLQARTLCLPQQADLVLMESPTESPGCLGMLVDSYELSESTVKPLNSGRLPGLTNFS